LTYSSGVRRSRKVFPARVLLAGGPVGRRNARLRHIRKQRSRQAHPAKKEYKFLFLRVRPLPWRQGGIGDTDKPVSGPAGPVIRAKRRHFPWQKPRRTLQPD
jgi:hypothetical protein